MIGSARVESQQRTKRRKARAKVARTRVSYMTDVRASKSFAQFIF